MRRLIAIACVSLSSLATVAPLSAQGMGGGSSGGVQTITSSGSGAVPQLTGISASATGAGSARTPTGSTANSGLSQPQFTQFGQAGANIGNGQFVGRANGQNFVGLQGAGQQSVNAGGQARFSGLGGQGGNNLGGGQAASSQARGNLMRVQHRLAFTAPPRLPVDLQANLHARFHPNAATNLAARFPQVTIEPDESGALVLRGSVEDDHARKLAEAIARLEPGVRKVTNELQVGPGPLPAP